MIEAKYWRTSVWLKMLQYRLRVLFADVCGAGPREFLRIGVSRFKALVAHFLSRHDTDLRSRFAALYRDREQLSPAQWAVREAGIEAVAAYTTPRFLDHPVHFFKAADGPYHWCDPATIWSPYVRSVKVTVVPGDHVSMLVPPDRDAPAEALSGFLRTTLQALHRRGSDGVEPATWSAQPIALEK